MINELLESAPEKRRLLCGGKVPENGQQVWLMRERAILQNQLRRAIRRQETGE
ncbi:hypothetical protein [Ottowia sp.]|uniref:hypothetical protein n=1 Tax=Ottowia sp. TaxID=1898956 RepID=UPI0025FA391F|nr:hypothetical protein [Ottowia sp.]MBK6616695.1 hypothetical protein [Ottowia sp.]